MEEKFTEGVVYAIDNNVLIIKIPSLLLDRLKSIEIYTEYGLEIALDHLIDGLNIREDYYIN